MQIISVCSCLVNIRNPSYETRETDNISLCFIILVFLEYQKYGIFSIIILSHFDRNVLYFLNILTKRSSILFAQIHMQYAVGNKATRKDEKKKSVANDSIFKSVYDSGFRSWMRCCI